MSHWTPFYEGDYIRDTRSLTQGEHGAYILLLTYYWSTGKPLPLEKEELYRITSAHSSEEKKNTNRVLRQFFVEELDGYHNKKSDEIITKKNEKRRVLSENGRKGAQAKAKANAHDLPEQLPKQMDKHNQIQNHNQKEEPPVSPPKGDRQRNAFRLPEDWAPDEKLLAWAKEKHPAVNIQFQTELFKNHYLGNGKRMVDWNRTWQNWIARALDFSRPNPHITPALVTKTHNQLTLEAWKAGKTFIHKPSGKTVTTDMIEPFDHLSQRVTEEKPTAFKSKTTGATVFFTEFEVVT